MSKKLLFVYNPKSGKSAIQKHLGEILDFYSRQGFLVTVYPTKCAGDARKFIADLNETYDTVVVSGGDGTINEAVNGIIDGEQKYLLGYLPMGSTNDFGNSIGLTGDLQQALETSVNGHLVELDTGNLNGQHFIYVAAFGLFTDVAYSTPQKLKNILGYVAYLLEGVLALTDLKAIPLTLSYNGQERTEEVIVGLISNSFQISGFKNPASDITQLNDGLFECTFVRMPKHFYEISGIISSLLNGNLTSNPNILSFQANELHIKGEGISWTLDGEYGGTFDETIVKTTPRRMLMRIFDDGQLDKKLLLPAFEDQNDDSGTWD